MITRFDVDRGLHKHAHRSMVHVRCSDARLAYPLVSSPSRRGLCDRLGLPFRYLHDRPRSGARLTPSQVYSQLVVRLASQCLH